MFSWPKKPIVVNTAETQMTTIIGTRNASLLSLDGGGGSLSKDLHQFREAI